MRFLGGAAAVTITIGVAVTAIAGGVFAADEPAGAEAAPGHGLTTTFGVQHGRSVTEKLAIERDQRRPPVADLPVPLGHTRAQLERGDQIFHGEVANGQCAGCHGADARGSTNGSDLTTGMYAWADGTPAGIKRILLHNMSIAPGMDGDLKPDDVDAVAVYVWALGRQTLKGGQ